MDSSVRVPSNPSLPLLFLFGFPGECSVWREVRPWVMGAPRIASFLLSVWHFWWTTPPLSAVCVYVCVPPPHPPFISMENIPPPSHMHTLHDYLSVPLLFPYFCDRNMPSYHLSKFCCLVFCVNWLSVRKSQRNYASLIFFLFCHFTFLHSISASIIIIISIYPYLPDCVSF